MDTAKLPLYSLNGSWECSKVMSLKLTEFPSWLKPEYLGTASFHPQLLRHMTIALRIGFEDEICSTADQILS